MAHIAPISADASPAQLAGCRACLAVAQIHPPRLPDGISAADGLAFFAAHAGHPVELLLRIDGAMVADRPIWDPMATVYFEVTNGRDRLLVRAARASIEEPIARSLVPGALRLSEVRVDVEAAPVLRALDAQFFPNAVRLTTVQRLLAAWRDVIRGTDAAALAVLYDCAEDPHASIARLPGTAFDELEQRSREILGDWELERVRAFLDRERGDAEALAVRVTRVFSLDLPGLGQPAPDRLCPPPLD